MTWHTVGKEILALTVDIPCLFKTGFQNRGTKNQTGASVAGLNRNLNRTVGSVFPVLRSTTWLIPEF